MREGGCLCGAVRYRINGEPFASGICHCRTCRKVSSAPTLPFVVFRAGQYTVTRGSPTEFRSSPHITRTFCGRCGSPLTYSTADEPDRIDVMTCSLDDPDAIPPTFHVWVSHRPAWAEAANGLPAYPTTRSVGQAVESQQAATGGQASDFEH